MSWSEKLNIKILDDSTEEFVSSHDLERGRDLFYHPGSGHIFSLDHMTDKVVLEENLSPILCVNLKGQEVLDELE